MIKKETERRTIMTLNLTTAITMLTCLLVSPLNVQAQNLELSGANRDSSTLERSLDNTPGTTIEMRASIVDKDGEQFIAKTEDGLEFRLPVKGAPDNVQIGDELRLIPDSDTQTIEVYKADSPESDAGNKQESQL
jgi:hypothetical protein